MRTLLRQFVHVVQIVRRSQSKNDGKINSFYRCKKFRSKNISFRDRNKCVKLNKIIRNKIKSIQILQICQRRPDRIEII